ncbi:MAG TPA: YCF48-related protein [Pseudomonadales bacterium]|nr:YCF48-related protein [Pseudomonadales bacterium]
MKKQKILIRLARAMGGVLLVVGSTLVMPGAVADQSPVTQMPAIKSNKVVSSLLQDIVRVDNRLVVVGERGHIALSDDHGKTWQQANVPTRQMLNAVYFVDNKQGWAVGYDGLILNTVDGGMNWNIQLDGLKFTRQRMADNIPVLDAQIKELQQKKTSAEAVLADAEAQGQQDNSKLEDAVSALEDKLSKLEADRDDAKAAITSDTVANPLMDVWFRDDKTGFAVGAFGEFLKTTDGGLTWASIGDRLENSERNHLNAITGLGNVMYIVGEAGKLYRSTDGGQKWALLPSPDSENGSFFAVNIIDAEHVIIGGLRGAIYRSSDNGNSWKQVPEDLHKNMNCIFFAGNDTVLAVGNDGALLRSRDGGLTFMSHVRKNRLTIASVVEAADGSYVMVGMGGVQKIQANSL